MYNVTIWYTDRKWRFVVYADSVMDAIKIGEKRACRLYCYVLAVEATPITVQIADAKKIVDKQLERSHV